MVEVLLHQGVEYVAFVGAEGLLFDEDLAERFGLVEYPGCMAARRASRPRKSICKARTPKSRLRSEWAADMAVSSGGDSTAETGEIAIDDCIRGKDRLVARKRAVGVSDSSGLCR
jgi:hypothetical protein